MLRFHATKTAPLLRTTRIIWQLGKKWKSWWRLDLSAQSVCPTFQRVRFSAASTIAALFQPLTKSNATPTTIRAKWHSFARNAVFCSLLIHPSAILDGPGPVLKKVCPDNNGPMSALSDGKNKEQVPLLQNEAIASIAAKHKKNNGHVLLRYQLDRG